MVMVETTLNYNHIDGVLGRNGRIFFPSQLLPFVIGLCSFVRVVYLRFELFRSPQDIKPSLAVGPQTPTRVPTMPHGKDWLKAFSPGIHHEGGHKPEMKDNFENSQVDLELMDQPRWWRYLCAWLPWLHASSRWFKHDKPEHETVATSPRSRHIDSPFGDGNILNSNQARQGKRI